VLEQPTAQYRTDGDRDAGRCGPDADRGSAQRALGKDDGNDRQSRREDEGGEQPEHCAGGDELSERLRQGGEHRDGGEADNAGDQHAAVAEAVAEVAAGQQ